MFQDPNDPVRAAAEMVERQLEHWLAQAWAELMRAPKDLAAFEKRLQPAKRLLMLAYGGGRHALLSSLPDVRKDTLTFSFDRLAPQTQEAADQFAAQWVREITDEIRQTIAATGQNLIGQGASVPRLTQGVRESIGLTRAQAGAVANYRAMLEQRSPEALNRALRDKRFDRSLLSHVEGMKPLSAEQIDKQVAAYHQRYLTFRARSIARYESLFASNAGAISGIRSGVKTGLLPAATRKAWLVANDERLCPKCRSIVEIQPDGVPLDAQFEWRVHTSRGGRGGTVDTAPLHVLCRCTVTFRVVK